MPCSTYWAHDSISRAGTRVSSPAQRPTIASTPSAPITIRARNICSPRGFRTRTCHVPSVPRLIPAASDSTSTAAPTRPRSEEHTSELQSRLHLVCRLLLEKKKTNHRQTPYPDLPGQHTHCSTCYT